MTFNDFKDKYGKYNAYAGWLPVSLAKEAGRIPEKYHEFFEDYCECGSENIISSTLTQETCIDPKCPIKVGYQLAEMFSRFGIKGLGYESCKSIYRQLKEHDHRLKANGERGIFSFDAFTEVLLLPWECYPYGVKSTAKGQDFYSACMEIREKTLTFSQMVSMLGLSEIGSNADRIFSDANSFTEWQAMVAEEGGVAPFCVRRGVYSADIICSVVIAAEAIAVADFALQKTMRKTGLRELKVCITGKTKLGNTSCTKAVYVEECNKLCMDKNGVQLLEIKNSSGPVTAPFVLYTFASTDNKYVVGASRGSITDEFGTHDVLMSTADFYNWLKGAMNEWNEKLPLMESTQMDFCQILRENLQKMREQKSAVKELKIF